LFQSPESCFRAEKVVSSRAGVGGAIAVGANQRRRTRVACVNLRQHPREWAQSSRAERSRADYGCNSAATRHAAKRFCSATRSSGAQKARRRGRNRFHVRVNASRKRCAETGQRNRPHASLADTRGLVSLLYSVVAAHRGADLLAIHVRQIRKPANRVRVAAQLVSVDPLRRSARVTEQQLEEPLGSVRILLLLQENVERSAVLVDRTPLGEEPRRSLAMSVYGDPYTTVPAREQARRPAGLAADSRATVSRSSRAPRGPAFQIFLHRRRGTRIANAERTFRASRAKACPNLTG
jgi:hypothetical protein